MNDNLKKSVMEFCPPSFILAAPRYIRITSGQRIFLVGKLSFKRIA